MGVFPRLNVVQIRAVAELLIEIGKWLLISVVLSSFLTVPGFTAGPREIIVSGILSLVLIVGGIWMLKEVKER